MAETYNINIEAKAEFDKIKELVAELNALNGQISKLNKATFSGVEKSARALIDTGNSLTDAIKAQTVASGELKKSTDKAADGLKNAQDKTASFKQQTASTKDVLTGFYLELGAMAARFATTLPSAITKSIDAFGRQEMAVTKLAAAIRSQGGSVSDVLPIMQSFASEIQRITTYGDEQILEIQSFAASMGVLPNQMNQVIKSAIGLSTALGTDLKSATRAAVSLTFGYTQNLQEQIPSLRNCKSETEKLAKAQQLASSGFAQAKDLAQTSAGKLKQAANAWGDLAETAGSVFAPVAVDVASLLKGMCEILSASEGLTAILTGSLTTLAVALTFQKIGGLPSLITQIKLVSNAVLGTDIAVKGLNATIKANPIMLGLSVAITAVSALTMAFSYFRGQAERTYKENIRGSEEYRSAIDSEIDALKQWGITADANKKRTAEVAAEIAKLKTEQRNYGTSHGQTRYGQGGAYKVYTKEEEEAQLDNYRAKIEKLQERQKAAADVKKLDALAAKKLAEAEASIAKIREKSAEEAAKAAGTNTALKKSAEMLKKATDELAAAEKAANDARNSGNAGQLLATEQRLAAAKTDRIAREKEYINLLQASDEEQRLRQVVKLQSQKVDLDSKLVALKGQAPSDDFTEEYIQNDLLLRANQLQSEYISSRKALCRTEKEYNALVEVARQKSEQILNSERMRVGIVDKIASAQNEDRRLAAATKLQDLEIKIVQAKTNGDLKTAQSLELTQKAANLELRRCEIVKEQVDALKASCRTAEDYNNLVAQANKIADNKLAVEQFELDLSSTRYKNSKNLNQLELDILKAKANSANYDKQGRNRAVEAIEDKKSILQLQEQIFDSLRRENMTADELKKLHDYAINQAQQRVALERQATDEAQKQNIAKNAQAKIEDIILTHKIEQLKAEGKTGAAKALEEERDIRRTLGGLDGVSAEDKKKLANMMRQTNAYKDRQNNRATPQAGGYAAPAGGASGGYYGSAPVSTGGRGPTPPKPPRAPATVSAKNMPLYEEWKAAGGTHTGQTFADFRKSRETNSATRNDSPNKFRLSASRFIDNVGERAGAMAGVKPERKTPQKSETSNKKDDNVADGKLSSALSDLKKNPSPEGEKQVAVEKILTDIQKTLNETKTTITQLKSSVSAIATSKK